MQFSLENIEEYLLQELSLEAIKSLDKNLEIDKYIIKQLWQLILTDRQPVSWRAAWALYHLTCKRKEFMVPYIQQIIELLPQFRFDGQKRELLKVLMLFDLKDLDTGRILNVCYDFLSNPNESLAVRVHSMQMIFNISELEPELKSELKSTILFHYQESSAGFQSRANKLLKKMKDID